MQKTNIDVLVSRSDIASRVEKIGREITNDYQGKELVVVGVLKGAVMFMSDLVREIDLPLRCDFLRVSSYDNDRSTGIVRMDFDMTQPVTGLHVLLVEDIVDTGRTLRHLLEHLRSKEPASLKVVSLLYKETGTGSRELVDYVGFEIPDRYVIGYGLDSEGLYRALPYVGAFRDR